MRPLRWLILVAALAYAVLSTLTLARAQALGSPESAASAGATLHVKDCVACHVQRMGGDGTVMYTRADRKVTSAAKLDAQIAACNSQLATGYFPEEEAHIAAYLNLRFYKFAR
jgi:mono/diheme cytochrome c family protein